MEIKLEPVAYVKNQRLDIQDDDWGEIRSEIQLCEHIPTQSLDRIEDFSHLEIIFYFHQVEDSKIQMGSRHPRNNLNWPEVGIFAQRGKNRPNKLGSTIVKLLKKEDRILFVKGLDALNHTPILDIKPVLQEFQPVEPIRQPRWSKELMKNYW